MRIKLLLAISASAMASALPAAQAPAYDAPIVVEGELQRDAAVRNYVNALAIASPGEKIARFEKSICPASVGLSDEMNRQVEECHGLVHYTKPPCPNQHDPIISRPA